MHATLRSLRIVLPVALVVASLVAVGLFLLPVAAAKEVGVYPVSLTVKPTAPSFGLGSSPAATATETNGGSATFTATACVAEVKVPGSSTYASFHCPHFKSFSLAKGASAHQTYGVYPYTVDSSTPKGTYYLKAYFVGKVGTTVYDTKTASFSVKIT
jgi:hypothetical protein